ncbi:MAG: hypothetical protein Q4G68_09680 [Planctomycetia bacterium]|nr:hypothetical protein [Planctomycetia bacterium]
MSIEQPVDQNLLEKTKQQIRTIVSEISKISKSDIAPDEFHAEFLPRVVTALAAAGGAIWTLDANGQLTLSFQVNLQEAHLHDNEEANKQHSRLLYKTLRSGETGTLVPAHSSSEGDEEVGNPTEFLAIFGVIKTELESVGLVEVFQRPESNPATQRGYLRFLEQMTVYATEYYSNRQLRNFGDRQSLWTQLEDFTRNIHKTLNMRETEYTVANESRRLIECDRVSIAVKRGNRCLIEAVSGQDMVDKRSSTVKLLGKLATAVVACNEPILYTGDTSDFAPQVEDAVEAYVDESHTKMVAVFPLSRRNVKEQDFDDTEKDKAPVELPFGAIIIENIEDNRVPERMKKRVEIVVEHARCALGNALDHNSVFLMPLWRAIGKSKVLVTARMLPKTISISAAVLLVLLAMFVIPWNFNMHCNGTLEPEIRRNIFAREEGKVDKIFVQHGSPVFGPGSDPNDPQGTLLLKLTNSQLEAELQKVQGDLAEVQKQLASLKEAGFRTDRIEDRIRISGQTAQYEAREKSLHIQLDILNERMKELEIHSPITGTVMTFDLNNKLQSRPVQPGQILMEIAEPDGTMILELDMPEKRMGYLVEHARKLREKDLGAQLSVDFVMMVDSTRHFSGKVIESHDRAENRGEGGTTVRLKASIDNPDDLPDSKRAGAGVSAKISCGRKPLGFVLFHEIISYFQKTVLFWLD